MENCLLKNKNYFIVFVLIIVSFGYYTINPIYFGDSPYYANDINSYITYYVHDSGHLGWRPLATVAWFLVRFVIPDVDPLAILRAISAIFSALLCFFVYKLAIFYGLKVEDAIFCSIGIGISKFLIAYGGSGCSYTSSLAFTVASVYNFHLSKDEKVIYNIHFILGIICFIFAWLMWGVSILSIFLCAFAFSNGTKVSFFRRFIKFISLGLALFLMILIVSYLYFKLFLSIREIDSYIGWMASASHGTPLSFSFVGILRAIYGLVISILHLGDIGTLLKFNIYNADISLNFRNFMYLFLLFICIFIWIFALIGFTRKYKNNRNNTLIIAFDLIICFIPVFFFAVFWKGSDIERFSLLLPFIFIFLIYGLTSFQKWLKRIVIFLLITVMFVANIYIFAFGRLYNPNSFVKNLIYKINNYTDENDLLIVIGQSFSADILVPGRYLTKREIYSISYDIKTFSSKGWENRLNKKINLAAKKNQNIYVLGDLIGEKSENDFKYNPLEFESVSVEEITEYFDKFEIEYSWDVNGFNFYKLNIIK